MSPIHTDVLISHEDILARVFSSDVMKKTILERHLQPPSNISKVKRVKCRSDPFRLLSRGRFTGGVQLWGLWGLLHLCDYAGKVFC